MTQQTHERVPTFCALCISRCGATASVADGRLLSLEPDPSHPTGAALCIKGKVAPELVYHAERLRTPLKRTRSKLERDPGWQPIGWDEALDTIAARLLQLSRDHGPESVVFSAASPSTSAVSDSVNWIQRLRRAFGSPNLCGAVELCAWGRYFATNLNLLIRHEPSDVTGGSVAHRACACNVARLETRPMRHFGS